MEKSSQEIDECNEPGEMSLQGLNPSFLMEVENMKQAGSPESGEIGEMSQLETLQMQTLISGEFSLTEAGLLDPGQEVAGLELEENNEPDGYQTSQTVDHPVNDQTEKATVINQDQQISSVSPVENEFIVNSLEREPAPVEEKNHIEQQGKIGVQQEQTSMFREQKQTNDQPEQANVLVEEQCTITKPKEEPFKILIEQFQMDNQPKQQDIDYFSDIDGKYLQLNQNHLQRLLRQHGDFQKQLLQNSTLQAQRLKIEPQQLMKSNQSDQQMSQLSSLQNNIQQLMQPNMQQIQDSVAYVQENIQPSSKETENKLIIEIQEENEHDEETPVFGVPNNVTDTLVEETQKLTIEEHKVTQVQGDAICVVTMPEPILIDLQEPTQAQIIIQQPISQTSQPITPCQQPAQQSIPPQVQPTTILNQVHSSVHQKTQIIIESQQQQIIVPQKVPEPTINQMIMVPQRVPEATFNQTMRLNAEKIRNLLLEMDSDWADIIRNASEAEILQFYQELTNKIDISNGQEGEITNGQEGEILQEQQGQRQIQLRQEIQKVQVQIELQQEIKQSQQPIQSEGEIRQVRQHFELEGQQIQQARQHIELEQTVTVTQQKPLIQIQSIQQQSQTTAMINIPQQQPTIAPAPAQPIPCSQPQPSLHPTPTITQPPNNQFQQFQLITAALYQTSPQLKQQIMKLSKQQLRALYRETMQENRKKQQNRNKNKKKKNSHPIIDLDDQQHPSLQQTAHNHHLFTPQPSQALAPLNHDQIQLSLVKQKPLRFSYLAQYQKRKSQSKKYSLPTPPSTPLFINKTLLYSLIKAQDYQNKLKSVLIPKQSIKYRQKTQKEIGLLYLNLLKKNKIAKGPFEATSTKVPELTVLCKKKQDIKGESFKKMAKEGLCVRVNTNLTEERKQRILELRQQRFQGVTQLSTTNTQNTQMIPPITTLPSTISTLPTAVTSNRPTLFFPQRSTSLPTPRRRYCLIVQEELSAREQQEIGLQSSKKRVKKSSNPEQEKELLQMLKRMIELEE